MKCTMCDFRLGPAKREKIDLADLAGYILMSGNDKAAPKQELDFVIGRLELERRSVPLSYNAVITVSGSNSDGDITVCTIAKFQTKVCPLCGKVLIK